MDSKTALSELQKFQSSRKSSKDYFSEAQNELGVGDVKTQQNSLRDTIRNTEAQLKGVGESVAGRTRGNLVTEAQRARLQSLESQPIAETLGSQQTAYSDISQNYRDLLSQAMNQAGMMYQTDADRLASLQGNYDRLYTAEQDAAAAEAARLAREESARQWQATFDEQVRQWNADNALRQAQINAGIASAASFAEEAKTSREQQQAIDDEAELLASAEAFKAEHPYNPPSLWDTFWQPMSDSLSSAYNAISNWAGGLFR